MTERERPYQITDALIPLASLAATYFIVTGAFSRQTRRKLIRRDGGCVASGDHLGSLHAAHISHDRNDPRYDDPSAGRILCVKHHLQDHITRHGRNGLSEEANLRAIELLRHTLSQQNQ